MRSRSPDRAGRKWTVAGASAQGSIPETSVKAAFIYNFAKFIHWPEHVFEPGRSQFTICVWGADALRPALGQLEGPEAKSVLTENADWLKQNPDKRIEIQGHCDERGSTEYNLALGMRRAQAAKQYLVDLGVEQSRLRATSFGEERPAVRGEGEMAWSKNRRGDFVPK